MSILGKLHKSKPRGCFVIKETYKGTMINRKGFDKILKEAQCGDLNDTQCAATAKISRNTFYKYAEELRQEL